MPHEPSFIQSVIGFLTFAMIATSFATGFAFARKIYRGDQ